jgi:hypothetical protein
LHHREGQYRYGDSNPGFRRERANLSACVFPDVPSSRRSRAAPGAPGNAREHPRVHELCTASSPARRATPRLHQPRSKGSSPATIAGKTDSELRAPRRPPRAAVGRGARA